MKKTSSHSVFNTVVGIFGCVSVSNDTVGTTGTFCWKFEDG